MEYRRIKGLEIPVSVLGLGTWPFGSDKWWGHQDDQDSFSVLEEAVEGGVTLIDTAPVYGKGYSERVVGKFLKDRGLREKIILATKLGLSWQDSRVYNNLKRESMCREIDQSRERLQTDYIDIYQVHWPDMNTPIQETAETMLDFYNKGIIKAVGVSNYSIEQMQEFKKYSPLHTLQPPYNMFRRGIEKDIISYCRKNDIAIISYVSLHSGVLTGKFFFDKVKIPNDLCRKMNRDIKEPYFSLNKKILRAIKDIAHKIGRAHV